MSFGKYFVSNLVGTVFIAVLGWLCGMFLSWLVGFVFPGKIQTYVQIGVFIAFMLGVPKIWIESWATYKSTKETQPTDLAMGTDVLTQNKPSSHKPSNAIVRDDLENLESELRTHRLAKALQDLRSAGVKFVPLSDSNDIKESVAAMPDGHTGVLYLLKRESIESLSPIGIEIIALSIARVLSEKRIISVVAFLEDKHKEHSYLDELEVAFNLISLVSACQQPENNDKQFKSLVEMIVNYLDESAGGSQLDEIERAVYKSLRMSTTREAVTEYLNGNADTGSMMQLMDKYGIANAKDSSESRGYRASQFPESELEEQDESTPAPVESSHNDSKHEDTESVFPVEQQAEDELSHTLEVKGYLVGAEPSQGFDEQGRPNPGLLIFQATEPGTDKYGTDFQAGCRIAVRFPVVKGEGHGGNLTITGKDGKPYHYWAEKVLTPGNEYVVTHAPYTRADGNQGLLLQIQDAQ